MKTCCIVGAVATGILPKKGQNTIIIAADAGLRCLKKKGIEPNLIVGDFDSLGYTPDGKNVIRHPVMKDDTDTMLAVQKGMEAGCDTFIIYGGIGGREDHTFSNIQTLGYIAKKGCAGYLINEDINITVIENSGLRFCKSSKGIVSVFSVSSKSEGVYIHGLKYTLDNAVLNNYCPIGTSNEFTGNTAEISVENGMLAIMWQGDFCFPEKIL